ncbi:hypothetical protein SBADM41S_11285 [Streptomyces badius]
MWSAMRSARSRVRACCAVSRWTPSRSVTVAALVVGSASSSSAVSAGTWSRGTWSPVRVGRLLAGRGRVPAGTGRLERLHRVAGPVVDPARLDAGLGQGGVALVDVPGVGGHPEERRALAAVQEVPVVLDLRVRERGDRLAQEVGVNLLPVVQLRPGPLRADRGRELFGRVRLQMGVAVDPDPLLRGEVRQGAHEVLSACLITGCSSRDSRCRKNRTGFGPGRYTGMLRVGRLRVVCCGRHPCHPSHPRGRTGCRPFTSRTRSPRRPRPFGPVRPRQLQCRGRPHPGWRGGGGVRRTSRSRTRSCSRRSPSR